MWIVCLTTWVSDRHLTVNVGMHWGDNRIKTAWQTRWLVAVHLDPMVGLFIDDCAQWLDVCCDAVRPECARYRQQGETENDTESAPN